MKNIKLWMVAVAIMIGSALYAQEARPTSLKACGTDRNGVVSYCSSNTSIPDGVCVQGKTLPVSTTLSSKKYFLWGKDNAVYLYQGEPHGNSAPVRSIKHKFDINPPTWFAQEKEDIGLLP